jgi:hypothetical protein
VYSRRLRIHRKNKCSSSSHTGSPVGCDRVQRWLHGRGQHFHHILTVDLLTRPLADCHRHTLLVLDPNRDHGLNLGLDSDPDHDSSLVSAIVIVNADADACHSYRRRAFLPTLSMTPLSKLRSVVRCSHRAAVTTQQQKRGVVAALAPVGWYLVSSGDTVSLNSLPKVLLMQ